MTEEFTLKRITIDTNVLMNKPQAVKLLLEDYQVVIPITVIEELDNLKTSKDGKKAYEARRAIHTIEKVLIHKNIILENSECSNNTNDDKILDCAERLGSCLLTYDLAMKIKAMFRGIEIFEYNTIDEEYKGYKIIEIDTTEEADNIFLSSIYEGTINLADKIMNLHVNEYLIIRDKSAPSYEITEDGEEFVGFKTIDIKRFDGKKLVDLKVPKKQVIEPWNDLQKCSIDLLYNNDIPIKYILGKAGTGKSKLATTIAFHLMEDKGKFQRMFLVRNIDNNTLGFLSGSKHEKIVDSFKPIFQHLDLLPNQLEYMIIQDKLVLEVPQNLKGLDIKNAIIITDESEDLNVQLIKRIGSRASENSVVVFLGDYDQVESKYKNNNGLLYAIEHMKDNPLAGTVIMDMDVRSTVSQAFAEM